MNQEAAPTSTDAAPAGKALLFTAFEPSGDDHASVVIAELKRRHPALTIYAWGGARMERAGATLVARTGDDAVMGVPGLAKIREHQRINADIRAFLAAHRDVRVHVPVDSPAANAPICDIARAAGLKVVHLVAPQIWAWGRWRIHALRRRTDLVLCVLPFEEQFFRTRRVPARFIGHMLFDVPLDFAELDRRAGAFPAGEPRIALMPGSRPDELRRHWPVLLDAFRELKRLHPGAAGVVAATGQPVAALLREMAAAHSGWPDGLHLAVDETDAVVRWCQLALVKSGTITLQVARQYRPMVVFYKKSNPLFFLIARLVLSTRLFSLPNVLARRRMVPELVPHFGGPRAIVREAEKLLTRPDRMNAQIADLRSMLSVFEGRHAASNAADAIGEIAGLSDARGRAAASHARAVPAGP